jgi:carboxyl-terminal processing protease
MMRQSRLVGAVGVFATVLFVCSWNAGLLFSAHAEARALSTEFHAEQNAVDPAKLYDAVVETVERNFFDEALLRQLDWRERAKAVRPSVLAAATSEGAVHEINALLSELRTSHTALFTPDDYEYYILLDILGGANAADLISRRFWGSGPFYPGIGVFTKLIDGHHFVDGVFEGSPAARAGLKYGDEVLSVDGTPYSPIAVFRGKIGTAVELKIRRHLDAEPQSLQVLVIPIRPTKAFSEAAEASARIIEQNGKRIGYAHIWASEEATGFKKALARLDPFNVGSDREAWDEAWRLARTLPDRLRRSLGSPRWNMMPSEDKEAPKPLDFLIVDMRGRVGGRSEVAREYLELLDTRRAPYWGRQRSIRSYRDRPGPARAQNAPFRGRSALLIDHHTRSAAEIMAHGYKRSAFGPVIGTPTAGAVSSGAAFVMPGDMLLYVAVLGLEFDGQPLEGVGVTPDHRVERPLPYAAGADPVLDAAVDLLVNQPPK